MTGLLTFFTRNILQQFITSTFHVEQVKIATQWLSVAHQHRVSSIREMEQSTAISFVNKLQPREGGGGAP